MATRSSASAVSAAAVGFPPVGLQPGPKERLQIWMAFDFKQGSFETNIQAASVVAVMHLSRRAQVQEPRAAQRASPLRPVEVAVHSIEAFRADYVLAMERRQLRRRRVRVRADRTLDGGLNATRDARVRLATNRCIRGHTHFAAPLRRLRGPLLVAERVLALPLITCPTQLHNLSSCPRASVCHYRASVLQACLRMLDPCKYTPRRPTRHEASATVGKPRTRRKFRISRRCQ